MRPEQEEATGGWPEGVDCLSPRAYGSAEIWECDRGCTEVVQRSKKAASVMRQYRLAPGYSHRAVQGRTACMVQTCTNNIRSTSCLAQTSTNSASSATVPGLALASVITKCFMFVCSYLFTITHLLSLESILPLGLNPYVILARS